MLSDVVPRRAWRRHPPTPTLTCHRAVGGIATRGYRLWLVSSDLVDGFGDYIVYVDESGDHSLTDIDRQYPVFVLAFCIFRVDDYVDTVVPAMQRLKFDFYGHDMVVLHEREIRKSEAPFEILLNRAVRTAFLERLNAIVDQAPFTIVAVVIDKERFKGRVGADVSPYGVALEFGLERVFLELQSRGQVRRRTHIVFEGRGRNEDRELELQFRRIMDNTTMVGMPETLEFLCADKKVNSAGLQIADMVARPIGLHWLRPDQPNRAWDALEPKIRRSMRGEISGWGYKVYP